MAADSTDFAASFRSSGMRATLPRLRILDFFQHAEQKHWSAEEVYKALLAEGADFGLGTVYRVLMQFEQAGILRRNHFEAVKSVFELNQGEHHDHMVCVACGAVDEFVDKAIEARQREIALERGFELREHRLALFGFCRKPACQAKRQRSPQLGKGT